MHDGSIHLSTISRTGSGTGAFPFSVPAIRMLQSLDDNAPVTFFVGENGSGKSTLLEGIAAAAKLPAVGSNEVERDDTLEAQRKLGKALRLSWTKRATRGFFLRAEDFFGFLKRMARLKAELMAEMLEAAQHYKAGDRSPTALGLKQGPLAASLADMERRYGAQLDGSSHGESFLKLFQSRFVPGGLYLLDEPEAPLSPQSQLALLAMLGEMIGQRAQFIIATHSPILLAFPGARIYTFDDLPVKAVAYDDLDHVRITRDFLNAPDRYLKQVVTTAPAVEEKAPSRRRKGARG
jgi:predicted ATPase